MGRSDMNYTPPHLRPPTGMEYPEGILPTPHPVCPPSHLVDTPTSGPIFIPKRPLTYLACPYSHPDKSVQENRYRLATEAAAYLISKLQWNVFSPITHSHPLATLGGLQHDWDFWKKIDTEYLEVSERLVVLELEGWRESTGVTAEINIARDLGVEVHYMRPSGGHTFELAPYPMDEVPVPKEWQERLRKSDGPTQHPVDSYNTRGCPETWDSEAKQPSQCSNLSPTSFGGVTASCPELKPLTAKDWERARMAAGPLETNKPTPVPDGMDNPKDLIGVTKPPLRLIPAAALLYLAKAMEHGAKKYGPYNWRQKAVRYTVYLEAAMRHILAALDGEELDPESKYPHTAHAMACMGIILDAQSLGKLRDDRPTPGAAPRLIKEMSHK